MMALDTNIIVRLITQDDADQAGRARWLILQHGGLVQTTVLLECEWVLRSVYGLARQDIARAFAVLSATAELEVENETLLARAIEAYSGGMDFADAVHLAGSLGSEGFASFDAHLALHAPRFFPAHAVMVP